MAQSAAAVDAFFQACPVTADGLAPRLQAFVREQRLTGRPVVCVTSGGTTVPLEQHCVRFIDNFSGGTRGALSAECFLEAGYSVIFLNRRHSTQPFTKGLPSGEIIDCLLEVLEAQEPEQPTSPRLQVKQSAAAAVIENVLTRARDAAPMLLRIPFVTLFEYMTSLRAIAQAVKVLGAGAAFYLAAAVSDFYIPWAEMAEHKIQSGDVDMLRLDLHKVPKMLGCLRSDWAPEAFIVSFKLETDTGILFSKAAKSIARYNVHAVVANILETRKDIVHIVHAPGCSPTPASGAPSPGLAPGSSGLLEDGPGPGMSILGRASSTERSAVVKNRSVNAAPCAKPGVQSEMITIRREASEAFIEAALVARLVSMHACYRANL